MEGAPADLARYGNTLLATQGTFGSTAMANSFDQMRHAGATARALLVEAAAQRWQVPADTLKVSQGVVRHPASGRSARFGDLVAAAAQLPAPAQVTLKEPKDFVYIGKRVNRTDSRSKIEGTAIFTQDVRLPGMLVALVAHPPLFGARVKSFDARRARQVKGVEDVVALTSGVAVLARDFWTARKARDLLHIEWDKAAARWGHVPRHTRPSLLTPHPQRGGGGCSLMFKLYDSSRRFPRVMARQRRVSSGLYGPVHLEGEWRECSA